MVDDHSISQALLDLHAGDASAAQLIWERYLERLVGYANRKLNPAGRRVVDGEDIAQMAFANFFQQFEQGRFAKLEDRNDLWQVLIVITRRRAIDQIKKENALKAGGRRVKGESFITPDWAESQNVGFDAISDDELTPEFAMEVAEQFSIRMNSLGDPVLEKIATAKMEGFKNQEIAELLDTSLRSVERKLERIRKIWQHDHE